MFRLPIALVLCAWTAFSALPPVEGETLVGKKISLPSAFAGRSVVLISGFTKGSQKQTEAWARRVESDFPGLESWSLADFESVPGVVRGLVIRAIRSSVPAARQDRFIIATKGGKALKASLNCAGTDDACVVFLGTDGAVRWQIRGPVTAEAIAALRVVLHH